MTDDLAAGLPDRRRAREHARAERIRVLWQETPESAGSWDTDAAWVRLAQTTGMAPPPRPDTPGRPDERS